jgi:hypothetical protein
MNFQNLISRYKKERIGPWTWVLPILLCLVACGLAVLANLYPKIGTSRAPQQCRLFRIA